MNLVVIGFEYFFITNTLSALAFQLNPA